MAAGDAISGISGSIAAAGNYTIQPGSGVEWCIHNVFYTGNCEIYLTNGTTDVKFDTGSGNGGWIGQIFFLSNTNYLKLVNIEASAAVYFAYTGVQTK